MNSRTVFSLVVVLAVAILQLARPLLSAGEPVLLGAKQPIHSRAMGLAKSVSPAKAPFRPAPAHHCDFHGVATLLLPFAPRNVLLIVPIGDPLLYEYRAATSVRGRAPPVRA